MKVSSQMNEFIFMIIAIGVNVPIFDLNVRNVLVYFVAQVPEWKRDWITRNLAYYAKTKVNIRQNKMIERLSWTAARPDLDLN